jgi:hypothetical protein
VDGRFKVGVALGLVSVGCAAAPPGPRGPLSESGVQFAVDWSVAVASARYSRGAGQGSVESSSDYYGANLPLPPRRLEARLAPVSWADIGADLGWIDGGVDVRFGMPAAAGRFFAGNLAFGLRSGKSGPFQRTKPTHSYWARLEAYPLLRESRDDSHRAIVSLGLNRGVFYHEVPVSNFVDDSEGGSGWYSDFSTPIFREELRLEAALGYFLKPRGAASLLLAAEPYWVVRGNDGTGGPAGSSFRQSWGVVFVLTASVFLRAHQPDDAR